ncbi:hypothetical protein ADK76_00130 [Streptomyces griseoflavus]|uniref:hypothetical protein n=1 Tax=Streptomyces rimosus TaxID=1927 RepID=UPI0004C4EDE9|nr:hypothetical protein [Streptomyces rimosus]KOG66963.1 hypothetical protein ADK76_00130 [Streptomyces griseoflavus]
MTDFNPSPGREYLTRLMRASGHDGVLHVRTGGGNDAALAIPRTEGRPMTTPAPVPTRKEIQITGIRKHVAEYVTEIDGTECGARSNVWDTAMYLDVWIRAHADEYEHKKFVKRTEEPVNVYTKPPQVS